MTEEELHNYENAMYHFNDYQNTIDFAKFQGKEIGKEEALRQTVINALRMGLDLQTIVGISGLSLDEVQSIQASLK